MSSFNRKVQQAMEDKLSGISGNSLAVCQHNDQASSSSGQKPARTKTGHALALAFAAIAVIGISGQARADKLDDVISAGVLRCGVMLDFPPLGYRDASGEPQGFDVETCKDIAKQLGTELEIVATPAPQRVPALVSGTVDIVVGGTTPTLERAKTVTFTDPYNVGKLVVVGKADNPMTTFEDLKGKTVAVVRGTLPETAYMQACANWEEGCKNLSLATNAEQVTAVRQGRADAMIETNSFMSAFMSSDQGQDLAICCEVPGFTDWTSIAVPKGEIGLRDWLNLFIFWQIDSGRYAELYKQFYGTAAPSLQLQQ
jgi:ABC-type amino acid transport substrate-binding protein